MPDNPASSTDAAGCLCGCVRGIAGVMCGSCHSPSTSTGSAAADAYERMQRARDEFIRHLRTCKGCSDDGR